MQSPETCGQSGRYELGSPLGSGGMGVVFRAVDRRTSRRVAVKILKAELADHATASERFTRELQALARLSHPHVVQLVDFGTTGAGLPFLVMELAEGPSLAEVLDEQGRLPAERVVGIARQLAWALAAAHAQGVVHRDVKPTNIVLLPDVGDRGDVVKLLDFGVSRVVEDTLDTQLTGDRVVGTPAYTSPEQARGEAADPRSDLYALGAVLYHALCGEPPFSAETPMGLLYHHVHTPPEPLSARAPETPGWLAELVMTLLRKTPEDRPASALAVLDRLDAEAAPAVPPSRRRRHAKWRPWLLGAAAGAVATAMVMMVFPPPAGPPRPTPHQAGARALSPLSPAPPAPEIHAAAAAERAPDPLQDEPSLTAAAPAALTATRPMDDGETRPRTEKRAAPAKRRSEHRRRARTKPKRTPRPATSARADTPVEPPPTAAAEPRPVTGGAPATAAVLEPPKNDPPATGGTPAASEPADKPLPRAKTIRSRRLGGPETP